MQRNNTYHNAIRQSFLTMTLLFAFSFIVLSFAAFIFPKLLMTTRLSVVSIGNLGIFVSSYLHNQLEADFLTRNKLKSVFSIILAFYSGLASYIAFTHYGLQAQSSIAFRIHPLILINGSSFLFSTASLFKFFCTQHCLSDTELSEIVQEQQQQQLIEHDESEVIEEFFTHPISPQVENYLRQHANNSDRYLELRNNLNETLQNAEAQLTTKFVNTPYMPINHY